jgi:uncharacterized membrane protein
MFFISRRFYPFAYFLGLCLRYPNGIVISFGLLAFLVVVVTIAFICVENREARRPDTQDKDRKEKGKDGDAGENKKKQTKAE